MSHIIGRPDDDILDVMLGPGADPEQALIRDSEQTLDRRDGSTDESSSEAAHLEDQPPTRG